MCEQMQEGSLKKWWLLIVDSFKCVTWSDMKFSKANSLLDVPCKITIEPTCENFCQVWPSCPIMTVDTRNIFCQSGPCDPKMTGDTATRCNKVQQIFARCGRVGHEWLRPRMTLESRPRMTLDTRNDFLPVWTVWPWNLFWHCNTLQQNATNCASCGPRMTCDTATHRNILQHI